MKYIENIPPRHYHEILMGAFEGLPDRDGYIIHHWDRSGQGSGGTAQYWRPGEPASSSPMPPNPYPEYCRAFNAGFWPGMGQGWLHGRGGGSYEGRERGLRDAWGTGAVYRSYTSGHDRAWPIAEHLGYEDAYGIMDRYEMDGYDDYDGYGFDDYDEYRYGSGYGDYY